MFYNRIANEKKDGIFMTYKAYTRETLKNLGLKKVSKGCQYIHMSIEYLLSLDKYTIPNSNMIYSFIANQLFLETTSVENSIRNAIQIIWKNQENPSLMMKIFGPYNLKKRPCNMEFLMLLYNYVRFHFENTEKVQKLEELWFENR